MPLPTLQRSGTQVPLLSSASLPEQAWLVPQQIQYLHIGFSETSHLQCCSVEAAADVLQLAPIVVVCTAFQELSTGR